MAHSAYLLCCGPVTVDPTLARHHVYKVVSHALTHSRTLPCTGRSDRVSSVAKAAGTRQMLAVRVVVVVVIPVLIVASDVVVQLHLYSLTRTCLGWREQFYIHISSAKRNC